MNYFCFHCRAKIKKKIIFDTNGNFYNDSKSDGNEIEHFKNLTEKLYLIAFAIKKLLQTLIRL